MTDIQWDHTASLMRVHDYNTADSDETLEARGTLHELVGAVLEMPVEQQDGLMIRAAGPDWSQEFDIDAIRELAARPEYTGAHGAFDTADLPEDTDRAQALDAAIAAGPADTVRQPGGSADEGTG